MNMMPLHGVRVLDFTRHLAGPYATTFLGDFGADVIKVESLPNGDPTRHLHNAAEDADADSLAFVNYNHGKRSLAIDMRTPTGLEAVLKLAAQVDVVIENYRPGVASAIGIGYEDLATHNPGLVYCSISAFGQEGPWSRQPATDPVIQAMSGFMSLTGFPGVPARAGVPIADVVGAMAAVQGILLALLARDKTGLGQWVDVSMLHALVQTQTTRLAEHYATGKDPGGQGNAHSLVAPYEVFETSDGSVVAGSWAEDTWPRFCRALNRFDLLEDERFTSNVNRVAHREELAAIISAEMKNQPTSFWQKRFHDAKGLFGPVLSVSQVLEHEQMAERPSVVEVQHSVLGPVTVPNPSAAVRLHGTPGGVRIPPPSFGEHGRDILIKAGLSTSEIDELVDGGVLIDGAVPVRR